MQCYFEIECMLQGEVRNTVPQCLLCERCHFCSARIGSPERTVKKLSVLPRLGSLGHRGDAQEIFLESTLNDC